MSRGNAELGNQPNIRLQRPGLRVMSLAGHGHYQAAGR